MSTTLTLGPVTLQLPLSVRRANGDEPFVVDADGNSVFFVNYLVSASWDDDVPLATLFAAAPDLLVAAEALVADYDESPFGTWPQLEALRTAIARARGKENT